MKTPTLLILGGTLEAYQIAERLVNESSVSHLRILTSLSGVTKNPRLPEGQNRIGGFGDVSGFTRFINEERVIAVIDATHPYAVQISINTVSATNHAKIPLIRLDRPPWIAKEDDQWISFPDAMTSAAWLQKNPQRTFLTIGCKELHEFRFCSDSHFIIRTVNSEKKNYTLPNAEWVDGRGPFLQDAEFELFQTLQVTALVSKNSGGNASFPKIIVARQLGIKVLMIQRPLLPPCKTTENYDDLIKWCLEI